ncbi:phage protein [Yersinia phage phiR1-RT]|uniref:Phage protein n=1 Tax=Yersinia phage phiR1-RT TaxID=1206558 RepID=I7K2X7_BPPR1|nr:phage protein [Yersinia phage phiR1-RT]CCI88646.1 phage protein [Yersinia phage phiR1-RT]
MSQAIKNVLNSFAFNKIEAMMEQGTFVTHSLLDEWEIQLHGNMKENDQKIGKARIRELLVEYILREFDIKAFGIESKVKGLSTISDSAIRKMKNQRKKGFRDVKSVKAAL